MCPHAGMHHSRGDVEFALEFNGTLTGGRVVSLSCARLTSTSTSPGFTHADVVYDNTRKALV